MISGYRWVIDYCIVLLLRSVGIEYLDTWCSHPTIGCCVRKHIENLEGPPLVVITVLDGTDSQEDDLLREHVAAVLVQMVLQVLDLAVVIHTDLAD